MSVVRDELRAQQALQARCFHASGAWTAFPQSTLTGSLAARFEEMVVRYPDRLAVWHEETQLTYAELNQRANQVADQIFAQAGDHTRPVILLFSHTPVAVVALLAVLKTGRFYTPFDPTQPVAHLAHKASDSQANLLLTEKQFLPVANALNCTAAGILCLDALDDAAVAQKRIMANPQLPISAETAALLLYTSGSTGQPKGILLNHRALLHRIKRQQEIVHIGYEDRCACVHTYDAIAGLRDLLCPLLNGAATYLFDVKTRSLAELPVWLQQHGISILGLVTPTFRQLLSLLTPNTTFGQMRMICIGGDTLYRQDVEHYRQAFPPTAILYNSLGATETAGGFCYYLFDHQSSLSADPLPVGYPMIDMAITILDAEGQTVAPGETGEIVLTTPYLAQGYWGQATGTANRFCATAAGMCYRTGDSGWLRADGSLIHSGRIDNQVKIRGYRIELGEVERVLVSHPAVQEAVVIAHARTQGEAQLITYWVAKPTPRTTRQELRLWLTEKLPAHMIPSLFVALEAMPLTPNGKLDRRALPAPDFTLVGNETLALPRTLTEQMLTELWRELLGIERIGIHDDFFQLGGHSFLAVHLLVHVEQQFQQRLTLRQFIFTPTIAHLATLLDAAPCTATNQEGANAQQTSPHRIADTALVEDAELGFLYDAVENKTKLQQLRRHNSATSPLRSRLLQMLLWLPQPAAMQLLAWLTQQSWVQQHYCPGVTALVQQFLSGLEPQVSMQKNLVATCLFFGFLSHWELRNTIFQRLQAERSIRVEGLAMVTAAQAQKQGVILLGSHLYHAPYFRSLKLAQSGIANVESLLAKIKYDKAMAEQILYARQLELAYQTLQQGGVVAVEPDANRGYGPRITVPFHGRMRQFHTSFAELALLTQAQLFFVASDLQRYNQFSFRLVGPFDMGAVAMSHEARVRHLMAQYVAHLRQQWARNPWALPWWLMREHLAYLLVSA